MEKILFVTNESSHGGAERMLVWLANRVSASGKFKVIFCNLSNSDSYYKLNEEVKFYKYSTDISNSFLVRNTVGLFKKTSYIKNIIKSEKIDLVVNFNDHAIYNIFLCKLTVNFKLLVSQRVDPFSITSKTGKFRLKLIEKADGLVCQTESALEFFNNTIKSTVINNPVYNIPKTPWNIGETEKTIINVARIELKQKRQDVLLKAFKIVSEKYNDVKLLIFGQSIPEDLAELNSLISKLNLGDNVEYRGVSDKIVEEMRKSRVFVLSSDYEGIPNAVIEAMSLGMPIVSTDCKPGGARLLLEDGSGVLVPIGDYNGLAESLIKLIEDDKLAVSLGNKARVSVKKFDENIISTKWIGFIEKILEI